MPVCPERRNGPGSGCRSPLADVVWPGRTGSSDRATGYRRRLFGAGTGFVVIIDVQAVDSRDAARPFPRAGRRVFHLFFRPLLWRGNRGAATPAVVAAVGPVAAPVTLSRNRSAPRWTLLACPVLWLWWRGVLLVGGVVVVWHGGCSPPLRILVTVCECVVVSVGGCVGPTRVGARARLRHSDTVTGCRQAGRRVGVAGRVAGRRMVATRAGSGRVGRWLASGPR